jgi:hypothetical protein
MDGRKGDMNEQKGRTGCRWPPHINLLCPFAPGGQFGACSTALPAARRLASRLALGRTQGPLCPAVSRILILYDINIRYGTAWL